MRTGCPQVTRSTVPVELARRPPYAVTYRIHHIGGHVEAKRYPALLLDWRAREVRPGLLDWFGLVVVAEPETLNPMVPFEMRCHWVPSSDIRPVDGVVAWMPEGG